MSRETYEQVFSDWSYLWKIHGPAADMTGGYVDQEDLSALLKSPTKATARKCLLKQIAHWFQVGPEAYGAYGDIPDSAQVREIAERYGHD